MGGGGLAAVAQDMGGSVWVDNTVAARYLWRPRDRGADIVTHSPAKCGAGHGNSIGAVVLDSGNFDWSASDKFPALSEPDAGYHGLKFHETFGPASYMFYNHAVGLRDLGAALAPMNAWLTIMGIETVALRMQRHSDNAMAVAEWLKTQPQVAWVSYAGLADSAYNALQKKYLPKGAGAVFTFGLKGGYEAGVKLVESVELFSHLANIGDTRSLIIHPSSTTHRQLTPQQQHAAGAGPDVVRVSVGLENVDDIKADLPQALAKAG